MRGGGEGHTLFNSTNSLTLTAELAVAYEICTSMFNIFSADLILSLLIEGKREQWRWWKERVRERVERESKGEGRKRE